MIDKKLTKAIQQKFDGYVKVDRRCEPGRDEGEGE
jgi:hypothetical protein